MTYIVPHYIEGARRTVTTPHQHLITPPATGVPAGELYVASKETCQAALLAAHNAWPNWAQTPPAKRAAIFFRFHSLLNKNRQELIQWVTQEQGKTLADAAGSFARALEVVEYYCGLMHQLQGQYSAQVTATIDTYTFRQPLGVCVGISPFNFPLMVPLWLMLPALAYGNTFILKPSERDPSATLRLFDLLSEAGLPDGVANCLQGDASTVEHLITHPDVAAVAAVASTPVAETIYHRAIAQGKRAQTFGGAKNHAILLPDAPLDTAATAILGAAFGSAGERCMAISAVIAVGDPIADAFIAQICPKIKAIRIGPGDQAEIDMGPLISAAHRQRMVQAIETGLREGATLLLDGRTTPVPAQGFFMGPSLFDQVTPHMSIYQEELFGPILVILRVATLEEALLLVNQHPYGNGVALFTQEGYAAHYFSQRVQAGMVGINVPIPVPIASHPFGGWKRSSFGDIALHGEESIHFYTRPKTIVSQWSASSAAPFTMPVHHE